MPDSKTRINKILVLSSLILCLLCGFLFTQSSANPSPIRSESSPDVYVANKKEPSEMEELSDIADENTDSLEAPLEEDEPDVTEAPVETPSPTPVEKADNGKEVSPEAEKGIWKSSGSNWLFLVDGNAYTGWLYDTDGHCYYFNKEGIMQTGLVKISKKTYYFDLDGILQTSTTVTVDGKEYKLNADGSVITDSKKKKDTSTQKESDKTASANTSTTSNKKKQYLAITFDDGPSSFTNRLLDCLEEHHAKATFFMVGTEIEYFQDTVKRIASLGHEIGNHSYSHKDLTTLSKEDAANEINKTNKLLKKLTGHSATVIRPPYGALNTEVSSILSAPAILWSVDTLDWETQDPEKIVDVVMEQATDGAIILLHDIYSTTVDAAEIFIPKLIKQGYELVTVHKLAELKKTELTKGSAYRSFN